MEYLALYWAIMHLMLLMLHFLTVPLHFFPHMCEDYNHYFGSKNGQQDTAMNVVWWWSSKNYEHIIFILVCSGKKDIVKRELKILQYNVHIFCSKTKNIHVINKRIFWLYVRIEIEIVIRTIGIRNIAQAILEKIFSDIGVAIGVNGTMSWQSETVLRKVAKIKFLLLLKQARTTMLYFPICSKARSSILYFNLKQKFKLFLKLFAGMMSFKEVWVHFAAFVMLRFMIWWVR